MDVLVALKLIFFGGRLGLLGGGAVLAFTATHHLDGGERRLAEPARPARHGVPALAAGARAPSRVAPGRCSS